jgi:fatty acid desaturase
VTKPFADNPKMLAEAQKQWEQKCHEALLAKYPDADETSEEIQAKAAARENQEVIEGWAVLIVAGVIIIAVVLAGLWFVWAFAGLIIPLALLIIALHFLGCF